MVTRTKFVCNSKKQLVGWAGTQSFVYEYSFSPVMDGSAENRAFYASTPSGNIQLTAVRQDLFEPGKAYYLDFTPADVEGKTDDQSHP
jgi:hypothetical protein